MMIPSYKYINNITLIISFYSTCLGMEQKVLINIPIETHKKIYNFTDLKSQNRLSTTCHYWKKIGNERPDRTRILRLLWDPSYSTNKTKTRILFYAVYNNDYNLIKYILENTPNETLYLKPIRGYGLDPYHVAKYNDNKEIIALLNQYHYDKPNYGTNKHNNKIECSEWPKDQISQELLIAAISADVILFEKTIHHTDFSQQKIPSTFGFGHGIGTSLKKRNILEDAFYIIVQNDDHICIKDCIFWIKNNPEFNFLLNLLLEEALEEKSLQVFTQLLQSKDDINKIEIWNMNGVKTERTLKNILLDRKKADIPQENYDAAKAILNQFGAKTVLELQQKESNDLYNKTEPSCIVS